MSKENEDFTPAEYQLVMEWKAAWDEEQEARQAWLDYAFGGEYPEDTTRVGKLARLILARDRRGTSVPEEAARLARAYVDRVEKRQELTKVVCAELAYSHPEWLAVLNKELSVEEIEQMLGIEGEEDYPVIPSRACSKTHLIRAARWALAPKQGID